MEKIALVENGGVENGGVENGGVEKDGVEKDGVRVGVVDFARNPEPQGILENPTMVIPNSIAGTLYQTRVDCCAVPVGRGF